MSAIDQLKGSITIGNVDPMDEIEDESEASDESGVMIDTTSTGHNRVDLSGLTKGRGNHQVVLPNPNKAQKREPITSQPVRQRKAVEIDAVAQEEAPDPNIKHSYEEDILDLDNPDSIFSKYVTEKEAEAREWIAEQAEKQAVEQAEKQEEEELGEDATSTSTSGSLIDDTIKESKNVRHLVQEDDLDISGLLDDEEENMSSIDDTEILEEEEDTVEESLDEELEEDEVEYEAVEDDEFKDDADEEIEEAEYDDEEVVEEVVAAPKKEEKKAKEPESYTAELDLEVSDSGESFTTEIIEEDETATAEVDNDAVLKHLQKLATQKLKPVSKTMDISSFTVLKKPITNITPIFQESNARVCKWVLPAQESTVMMKEFSGAELEKLRQYSENNRSNDALNRRYHMIYDHIVSPKPATFEQWLKSTPFEDVDHYFFAIYIASFKGANYLPEDCINKDCNETFLTDDIDIMQMVKFDTKEAKKNFLDLYQSEATPAGKGIYCTEVVPVSGKIAIAFRQPSIYNVFEIASLNDAARNQFSSIIEYIPYIDTIYAIDAANKQLIPITYKMFPENAQKTMRSKLQKYDNIFNTLGVDEFAVIKAYIAALADKTTGMRYVYPAVECPKCHTMTEEQSSSAEELVFTRYQLGALVSTSLN